MEWFKRSADHGHAMGQAKVANAALLDDDHATAIKLYELAIRNDDAPKDKVPLWMHYLGVAYKWSGDTQTAEKWRKRSAERGCQEAKGADMGLLRAKAERGDAEACAKLSNNYLFVEKNEGEGRKWLLMAVKLGHGESAYDLYRFHEKGTHGFPEDYRRAAVFLQRAAELDHPLSMAIYGQYRMGRGTSTQFAAHIEVDHTKGRALLNKAKSSNDTKVTPPHPPPPRPPPTSPHRASPATHPTPPRLARHSPHHLTGPRKGGRICVSGVGPQ